MSNGEWLYSRGDEHQQGPVSAKELSRLAESGELLQDDLIWKEGMDEWVPANRLKGLTFLTPAPPSPKPRSRLDGEALESTFRDAQQKADEAAGTVWFLDLKFTRFVSATIVRVVWSVYLVLGILGLALTGVTLVLREPIIQAVMYLAAMVVGFVFLTLMFRVWLEAFMVVFRMAEDLGEMNAKLASR